MDKKTYYVSVGSGGEILEPKDVIGNFELEIRATEDELDKLQELFEDAEDLDNMSAVSVVLKPNLTAVDDELDLANEDALIAVYRMLYELGTEETKKHIDSMRILH